MPTPATAAPALPNLKILRFPNDPERLGAIVCEDGRWHLVIDHNQVPHLYVRIALTVGAAEADAMGLESGDVVEGWHCIDQHLDIPMAHLIDGLESGPPITDPEELEAAMREIEANPHRPPCPV